ncbi:MAG: CARDB domain-containing protein [Thiothrix sp.]
MKKYATILAGLTLMSASFASEAGCDLTADITSPEQTTQSGDSRMDIRVSFANLGNVSCPANTLSLYAYSGGTTTGFGRKVGGSGGFQRLPQLAPGEQFVVNFTERSTPPTGTHTYQLKYSRAHNDDNNGNHRPTKTYTFIENAGLPDLEPVATRSTQSLRVGKCNMIKVSVKNNGSSANNNSTKLALVGSQDGNPFVRLIDAKTGLPYYLAHVNPVSPGETQTVGFPNVEIPSAGNWQFQVIADFENTLLEEGDLPNGENGPNNLNLPDNNRNGVRDFPFETPNGTRSVEVLGSC